MTFAEIQNAVCDYCTITQPASRARVANAINQQYRRITASLNLDTTRFVTRSKTTTNGVQTVTFTSIEKIDRLLDTSDSTAVKLLQECSVHDIRVSQAGSGTPSKWAIQTSNADSVTILLDTVPQTTYSLQADGRASLDDLTDEDVPVFPESYHDILVWAVISEELLKKEKDKLALIYKAKAESLLSDLRFFLADSPTRETIQGSSALSVASGSGGGSGSAGGATAYTQSALVTFDLGSGVAPFAVAESDAPYVPNLGAEFIGDVTSDRLIGRDSNGAGESEQLTVTGGLEFSGSGGIRRSALSGDVTSPAGSTVTTIATGAVTTTKILDDAVTFAKLQNVTANALVGRGSASGTGDPQEIQLGSNLSMSGTSLQAFAAITTIPLTSGNTIDYTAGDDLVVLCNATSGAFTVSLPAAANSNQRITVIKTDSSANAVTIDPDSTETVGGESTLKCYRQRDFLTIVSDGSNWQVIGEKVTIFTSVYLSAEQTGVVTATPTKVRFDTETEDSSAAYDNATNYRFVPPRSGRYRITSRLSIDNAASIGEARIYVAGVHIKTSGEYGAGIADPLISATLRLTATTDYVEIFAMHSAGANRGVLSGSATSWAMFEYLGN